jgi:AhpD family alkylhydroperoxidase
VKANQKRIFSLKVFAKSVWYFIKNVRPISSSMRSKRIENEFSERLMLAVTSVNQCHWCAIFHSDTALKAGVDQEQIDMILKQFSIEKIADYEQPAMLYAIHFAESNQKPLIAKTQELIAIYGEQKAKDIEYILHVITFGNLIGNTLEHWSKKVPVLRRSSLPN